MDMIQTANWGIPTGRSILRIGHLAANGGITAFRDIARGR